MQFTIWTSFKYHTTLSGVV